MGLDVAYSFRRNTKGNCHLRLYRSHQGSVRQLLLLCRKEHRNLVAPPEARSLVGFCDLCLVSWDTSASGFLVVECSPIQEEQGLMDLRELVGWRETDISQVSMVL